MGADSARFNDSFGDAVDGGSVAPEIRDCPGSWEKFRFKPVSHR